MSWGGGSGIGARAVAEAFYAGKKCRRGNCETDGRVYILFGHAIARRNPDYNFPDAVAAAMLGEKYAPALEFRWAVTSDTTTRHLEALGLRCHKGRYGKRDGCPPTFDGREVDITTWYTPAAIEAMPIWKPPAKKPRAGAFVNITAPLFA